MSQFSHSVSKFDELKTRSTLASVFPNNFAVDLNSQTINSVKNLMDPQIRIPSIIDAHHSTQQSSSLDSNDGVYLNQDLESSFRNYSLESFMTRSDSQFSYIQHENDHENEMQSIAEEYQSYYEHQEFQANSFIFKTNETLSVTIDVISSRMIEIILQSIYINKYCKNKLIILNSNGEEEEDEIKFNETDDENKYVNENRCITNEENIYLTCEYDLIFNKIFCYS